MKAAVYYETGGPEVFRYEDVPDPVAGPGEVLVRVEAVSIEGGDTLNRLGGRLAHAPHIVGYQCAGTVLSTGAGVERISAGRPGGHRGAGRIPRRSSGRSASPFCWLDPRGRDHRGGGLRAGPLRHGRRLPVRVRAAPAGETALIHAGASGVGIAAIQLAKRAGATVLATASSDDRLDRLGELGLDHGINYAVGRLRRGGPTADRRQGRRRDRRLDRRADPAEEPPLPGLPGPVHHLRRRREGAPAKLDISTMRANNQTLVGYFLGAELFLGPRAHAMIAGSWTTSPRATLRVVIDRRFALEEAGEAHAYIESRQAFGRVLLIP